jgi:hypothetical protein
LEETNFWGWSGHDGRNVPEAGTEGRKKAPPVLLRMAKILRRMEEWDFHFPGNQSQCGASE